MPPPASRNALLSLAATTSRRPAHAFSPPAARPLVLLVLPRAADAPAGVQVPRRRQRQRKDGPARPRAQHLLAPPRARPQAHSRRAARTTPSSSATRRGPARRTAAGGGAREPGAATRARRRRRRVGGWVDSGVNPADFSRRLCPGTWRARRPRGACPRPRAAEGEGRVRGGPERTGRRRRLLPVELLEDGYAHVLDDPSTSGRAAARRAWRAASPDGVVGVAKYAPSFQLTSTASLTIDHQPRRLGLRAHLALPPLPPLLPADPTPSTRP